MAEFKGRSQREHALPVSNSSGRTPTRETVSAPQSILQPHPSQQLNMLGSSKATGQPSDYAPVAGASLNRLMEGQPVKKVSFFEWWHWKWHNLRSTRMAIEVFNGAISAFSAGVYVYDSYITITHVARIVYFIAAWTILVEYVAKLLASNNKLKYLFWSLSLIDAATIGFGLAFYWDTEGVTSGVSFIRALRMLQVVRFMRVLIGLFFSWLKGTVHPSQVELYKHLFDLLMTVAMVVFIGGCAFYEIEQVEFGEVETSPTFLHEGIYWACVTLTTVGYGDFYPTNVVTQMLFPVMIGIILVIVPAKVSALNAVMDSITPDMRRHHTAYRFGEHVVLMGHTNHKTVKAFVDEFFAPDHGLQEMQLVLLRTDPPGPDMRVMVSGHPASHRLAYIQGSPFVVEDLFRTDLTRAMAVFVMCNKYAQDVEQEDTNTLMTVLALSQYIRQNTDCSSTQWSIRGMGGSGRLVQGFGSETWKQQASKWMASNKAKDEVPHIIVQFHLPESIQRAKQLLESQASHPLELGLLPVGSTLFPMCLGSIKHSMIGASMRTPGLLTLIANLTMSCEVSPEMMPDNSGWICEYLNGAGIEMYEVQLPFEVHGMTYREAVLWLYKAFGVILLGLRVSMCDLNEPERFNVHLAPFHAEDLHLDVRVMMGIIMSQDDDFTGAPQGPKGTDPGVGIRPVPGRKMDLNAAMIMPEHGRAADEQWSNMGSSFRVADNPAHYSDPVDDCGTPRPVAEDAEHLEQASGKPRIAIHASSSPPDPPAPPPPAPTPPVQGNQQQDQQQQQQSVGGGLKVTARLSSSNSSYKSSPPPGGMAGMLRGLRQQHGQQQQQQQQQHEGEGTQEQGLQQAETAERGLNTDMGVHGGAASPPEAGGNTDTCVPGSAGDPTEGTHSSHLPWDIMWEDDAAAGNRGGEARAGCAVAEGSEHVTGPEPHGADASTADVQLHLPESPHLSPFQHQRSGLRHISVPSLSNPSASSPGTHLQQQQQQQQPGGLPSHSCNPLNSGKSREEQQGSVTNPVGMRGNLPSAPLSNSAPFQPPLQQKRTMGSMSPFQQMQQEGEFRGLQNRAGLSCSQSHFLPDNDAASASDMEHTTKEGPDSVNLTTSKKGSVRFGPAVTSDSSFPLLGRKSESSISGFLRPSRPSKQQDPQQIELVARCNSISEQAALMQRFTKSQTLKLVDSVKDLSLSRGCKDIILIIGDSCFPYLNDLVASIRGVRRSPLAAAVDLARKQRAEEGKRQAEDRGRVQETVAEEGLKEQKGLLQHQSKSAGQTPAGPGHLGGGGGLEQQEEDREQELCKAPIVIMDPVGPNSAQMVNMTELEDVSLLLGNPSHPKDLGRLGLTSGSRVRAMVLPYIADLEESAVMGYQMSKADACALTNCSNLRQYCTLIGADLEIVTEALSFVNVSYLLPLCINGPPYEDCTSEERDPLDNLDTLENLTQMGMHKMQRVSTQRFSLDVGRSSARPNCSSQPEPPAPKGPQGAPDMRLKRRNKHQKVLRPTLKSTVLSPMKHLPSKIKSLAPRRQLKLKVEEYVAQLLADIPALAPALATGHIYTASIVDKLFCMILFSPLLIQILTKMLGVWDCEEIDERDADILPHAISLMTKGSEGQGGSGPGQDQLLQREAQRLQLKQQILHKNREEEQLCEDESDREPSSPQRQLNKGENHEPISAHNPRIHLVSVNCFGPKHPGTKVRVQDRLDQPHTWADLFLAWAPRRLLPVGLYRKDPHTQFPYVYTSPTKATILRSSDMVYVLASSFDLP